MLFAECLVRKADDFRRYGQVALILTFFEMHKVFDITLRALDRRKGEMDRCKAIILCKGKSVFHHHHMSALFPYHALFPNQFPAGFKLVLDETNSFAALFQQPIQDRQHQLEGNE